MLQMPTVLSEIDAPQMAVDIASPVVIGNLLMQKDGNLLQEGRCIAKLSPVQTIIMKTLYDHAGAIVTVSQLLYNIHGFVNMRHRKSLQVLVYRLRKHLLHDPAIRLDTVSGIGYKLVSGRQDSSDCITKDEPLLEYYGLALFSQQLMKPDGSIIGLTKTYYDILKVFFCNPEKLITWDEFLNALNDEGSFMNRRVFSVLLSHIRKYLVRTDIEIVTKYRKGHMLAPRNKEKGLRQGLRGAVNISAEILCLYRLAESRLRDEILHHNNDTVKYTSIRRELMAQVDKALLNVRRKYYGYISNAYGDVARIINRNLPDNFY